MTLLVTFITLSCLLCYTEEIFNVEQETSCTSIIIIIVVVVIIIIIIIIIIVIIINTMPCGTLL